MNIKLIATDMDGTLLNYDNKISDENTDALLACQQKGIQVMLASGRSYQRLLPYVSQLQLLKYDGMFLEGNGMGLYSPKMQERTIFRQLKISEVLHLSRYLISTGAEIQVYFDDGVYYYIPPAVMEYKRKERTERNLPDDYPWLGGPWAWLHDSRDGYPHQFQIKSFEEIDRPVFNKINLVHDSEFLDQYIPELKKVLGSDYQLLKSCPRVVELIPSGISKGSALKYYMDRHGISPEEVVVFGDGENDISMFQESSASVAMGNATDDVKRKAAYVTSSNTENGIAAFLKKYVL